MSTASAACDHDRRSMGDRLHQRHINLRVHVSPCYCGSIRVNADECQGEKHAHSNACGVSAWIY